MEMSAQCENGPPTKKARCEEGPPSAAPAEAGESVIQACVRKSGGLTPFSKEFAEWMDAQDDLASFKEEFHYPPAPTSESSSCIYLCGNSLGLQPKNTQPYVLEELEKWQRWGVEGHFPGVNATRPWVTADEDCRDDMARIVGAKPVEIAVMNSLTVNLHLLMCAFYRPTKQRHKIMMEGKAFPSDKFAVASQITHNGFDPETSLVELWPREGEHTLRTDDIEAAIKARGQELAVVMFSGVQYYTGQFFQLDRITRAAREQGCLVGFDLAHAVGNVPLQLHDWGCDFACWCTYKYLNSGPGNIAGAFVHERHANAGVSDLPGRLTGWWGHRKEDRFEMEHHFVPSPGAQSFMLSNPPVLCVAALRASTDLFARAGMERLRAKSLKLTAYLEHLIHTEVGQEYVEIITPNDPQQRGCQLSLVFKSDMGKVHEALGRHGVVCDIRKPSVMRIAPAPLYNSFSDVFDFVRLLRGLLLGSGEEKQ
uniref:Kynureninase n=1 Tax=Alexandrium monilatum TaxID=311494 RepID=A0A7S4RHQ5_9DINO|mmetsp:Transcript_27819/g.83078  ORF Transcript_27819/g.83078 Transcript_27819/m.83078 type:complete len:481 (-) Transcript_27819:33-1475(-)|eukprot:CAMPEP_0175244106 /NCGR_PEP_ID=MMETSP0093-20121207/31919_1 /TAXON_ID=311494 /ORGANISM="Alexandrium monilatum, Strain CCMP3105" /LENGTH=480 /DNA_ID=CAMNT_0016538215 /DNA_START=34 /DNA_END=1476 /DNA_ORIENTATION=-